MNKRMINIKKNLENKVYSIEEGIELLKQHSSVKFSESLDCSIHLGLKNKPLRGSVSMPRGLGKEVSVLVFAGGEKAKEAEDAGADIVGSEELIREISKGAKITANVILATPDMMPKVASIAKILGTKRLMPTPKTGTVTNEIEYMIKDIKRGRLTYKMSSDNHLRCSIGKLSFDTSALCENFFALRNSILNESGQNLQILLKTFFSSTMGPAIKVKGNI